MIRHFWSLHQGRSCKPLVWVVPGDVSPLYRIDWPDLGLSSPANITRCKDAARQWAEQRALTEGRKNNAARRLKSLDNFWWLASPVRQIDLDGAFPVPAPERTAESPQIDGRLSAPGHTRFRRAAS